MAKGTYVVGEGAGDVPARDASYKSCLCALLVFIAICVIILLAGYKWTKDEIKKEVEDEVELLGLKGDSKKSTEPFERIMSESPTTVAPTRRTSRTPTSPSPKQTTRPPKIPPLVETTEPYQEPTLGSATITTRQPFWITLITRYPTKRPTAPTIILTEDTTLDETTTLSTAKTLKPVIIRDPKENEVDKFDDTTPRPLTTEDRVGGFVGSSGTSEGFGNLTSEGTTSIMFTSAKSVVDDYDGLENDTSSTSKPEDFAASITGVHLGDDGFITSVTPESDYATEGSSEFLLIKKLTTFSTFASSSGKLLMEGVTPEKQVSDLPTEGAEILDEIISKTKEYTTSPNIQQNASTTSTTTAAPPVIIIKPETEYEESSTVQPSDAANSNIQQNASTTSRTTAAAPVIIIKSDTEYEESSTVQPSDTTNSNIQQNASTTSTTATAPVIIIKPETTPSEESSTVQPSGQQQAISDDYDYSDAETESLEVISRVNSTTTTEKAPFEHERAIAATKIPPKISEPLCISVECKSAASRMLSLMNHSVDPCEDFYEFACGGMQADNADSDAWKRLSEQLYLIDNRAPSYRQKFKAFYDSCVSYEYQFDYQERISEVLTLVNEVGEILDGDSPPDVDVTELFAKLILRQSLPIMDIDVDIDKQTSNFILKLTLPPKTSILKESGRWSALTEGQKRCLDQQRQELQQPNLNLNEIHESYLTCQKDHTIYLNSIETVVRSLGFYSHLNNTFNQTQQIGELRFSIEFDILNYLNDLPPPNEVRKTILLKNYFVEKVSDLQVHYKFLQWDKLFKIITGHEITGNTLIQVYFREYFDALFQAIFNVPKWKINNALVAIYANELYENLVIPQARHKREMYCLKLSSKLFPDVASNMYMKTWAEEEVEDSQKFLTKMFDSLKSHLKTTFLGADWLDDDSKALISPKVDKIKLTFNKKEDLYNKESYLDLKYNDTVVNSSDFQNNAVGMIQARKRKLYGLQGKPFSIKDLWGYYVNAYDSEPTSFYSKFLVVAPLGMIKQPVRGLPSYITMARIGLSLAREIGRHFDPVGIRYGATLSSASQHSYDGMKENMEQENLFNVQRLVGQQEVTFEADSKLSANERIADNTGLRLVSDVFNRTDFHVPWISTTFSREKIFYTTVAQEYCKRTNMPEYMQQLFETEILPASLRVENIMTNSEDFSEVFECREGSAMNNNPMKVQFPYLEKREDYDYTDDEAKNISN